MIVRTVIVALLLLGIAKDLTHVRVLVPSEPPELTERLAAEDREIIRLLGRDRVAEAWHLAEERVRSLPSTCPPYRIAVEAARRNGSLTSLEREWADALRETPRHPFLLMAYATVLLKQDERRRARNVSASAIRQGTPCLGAYRRFVRISQLLGTLDEAEYVLRDLASGSKTPYLLYAEAFVDEVRGDGERALEGYRRALVATPPLAETYYRALPPEFPAFGPLPEGDQASAPGESDRLEIVGNFRSDPALTGPVRVESFDGRTARLRAPTMSIARGDLVVLYDDQPVNGSWMLGLVGEVTAAPEPGLEILTTAGATVGTGPGARTLPSDIGRYHRTPEGFPESGYLTPVSVVSYEIITSPGTLTSLDDARYLVRRLNWGEQDQVARIDSLEIRYFVGSTVGGPVSRNPPLRRGGPGIQSKRGGPDAPANGDEIATSVARCGETRLHHGQGPSGKRQAFRVADR